MFLILLIHLAVQVVNKIMEIQMKSILKTKFVFFLILMLFYGNNIYAKNIQILNYSNIRMNMTLKEYEKLDFKLIERVTNHEYLINYHGQLCY